jgi:hypothetical protein
VVYTSGKDHRAGNLFSQKTTGGDCHFVGHIIAEFRDMTDKSILLRRAIDAEEMFGVIFATFYFRRLFSAAAASILELGSLSYWVS